MGTGHNRRELDLIDVPSQKHVFAVYDGLTGRRVDCEFTEAVTLQDVTLAIEHRVEVVGEISYRDGNPVHIVAEQLTVFPPDDELPGPYDVLGILNAS